MQREVQLSGRNKTHKAIIEAVSQDHQLMHWVEQLPSRATLALLLIGHQVLAGKASSAVKPSPALALGQLVEAVPLGSAGYTYHFIYRLHWRRH
jgi:hypothetical protein